MWLRVYCKGPQAYKNSPTEFSVEELSFDFHLAMLKNPPSPFGKRGGKDYWQSEDNFRREALILPIRLQWDLQKKEFLTEQ